MKKLTLNAEESVIEEAKRIAREQGTSVSALFSRWIGSLAHRKQANPIPANSIAARARGIAQLPQGQSEKDVLADALTDKYGASR
ncbi:MAG: hypothetical protein JW818_20150 [Pirellulales bacterium]|nr:hypothetical protein [Pirellulales bacterium]